MKGIFKITTSLLVVLLLAACSRKKNTFLSRNFHAVTAEYNTLYNGDVAFVEGKEELALTYRDNFWEILPVERIELQEDIELPGASKNPKFNRAEEKAAKAIQKHSMFIDGQEYNPQIDEAYMLLGKARYFDQRFIPAQDAFNFILNRYPTSNNINRAKVWKAKTNIRLDNEDIALENLQEMMEEEELDDQELAEASAIMTQAYINLDSLQEAVPYIKLASSYENNDELKGRYAYIKGQLYDRLEMTDSANMAYDEVIELNRKSPRVYMINAYIAKARNFDYDTEDKVAFLELLTELEEDRENRPFLDRIYNQIGEYYRNNDSIDRAVEYYNKSITNFQNDQYLQSVNYRTLAEINFDAALYQRAGAYYDSTLLNLPVISKEYRRFKKKRENLDDVIKYETIAAKNDSILTLVAMSDSERLTYFTEYTDGLREQARLDSIAAVEAQEREANKEFYKKNTTAFGDKGGSNNSTFYFYNSTTLAYGKQEFKNVWGNRKLEDYWRLSTKRTSSITEEGPIVEATEIVDSEIYNPESYIAMIPTDAVVIDSLATDRNFAYYQLGLIYKEKFRENSLASDRLETLLTLNPEERLILPAKYNLYKIYSETDNATLADKYRNDIVNNYADSRYAEIILNPNTQLATDESSPEYKYNELYKRFENSEYQYVIATADKYITLYYGDEIVPKLEMLKATALARQDGYEPYKKALNFISLNYPNSKEGKEAEDIFSNVLPKLANSEFVEDEESENWKLVYQFEASEEALANATALREKLDEAIKEYNYFKVNTSIDYYDPNTRLVIMHGFNTRMGARGFAEALEENKDYKIKKSYFEIASPNYKTIQIHKNLSSYLQEGTEK